MKIRPAQAELLHAGTYRRTNIIKLIVAFRNISHAPKNSKIKKKIEFLFAPIFVCGNERAIETKVGKNTAGR